MAPTLFSDVDSSYFGVDKKVHIVNDFENYSTFSLWDTYRAAHPLYTIMQPRRTKDMINSLLAHYEQFGRLPVWNFYGNETDMMIGYHAVPVIVDAYLKGIGGLSPKDVLQACVTTANMDDYRGIGLYKKLGYVPYDVEDVFNSDNWSLSRTLEYAFDDYCISLIAKTIGNDSVAEVFTSRSKNYKNLYLLGRLATYKYINMDVAVKNAMSLYEELTGDLQD
jgi:predicted alpha-1,2-mannosidase